MSPMSKTIMMHNQISVHPDLFVHHDCFAHGTHGLHSIWSPGELACLWDYAGSLGWQLYTDHGLYGAGSGKYRAHLLSLNSLCLLACRAWRRKNACSWPRFHRRRDRRGEEEVRMK